jgi:BASS family bile acid:Na+ symporter
MNDIDSVVINFSPEKLAFLNVCLGFLLFGVALDIKLSHFQEIIKYPKAFITGVFGQLVLMPLMTIALIFIIPMPTSMKLGMILVCACPGGNVSNYAVYLAEGNTALSILLTSFSTLLAIVVTPLYFTQLAPLVPDSESLRASIYVEPFQMIVTILKIIVVPILLGMYLNSKYPKFTDKIKPFMKVSSLLIFFGIIISAVFANVDNIKNYLDDVFYIVFIHNSLALALGFFWAKSMKLSFKDVKAISKEVGLQNTGLALILIFNFFNGLGGMALIAACWGIWHMFSGFGLAMIYRRI